MPLTCINHLCRFLQSSQHGAVPQPVGEARCHMFQLRWIKLEVGGGSAQRRAAACERAPRGLRTAAFWHVRGTPGDLLLCLTCRSASLFLSLVHPMILSAACLCEQQSIYHVGWAAVANPRCVAWTGAFCASSPNGTAVIWLRKCWNEKTEQLSLTVFVSLLFSSQQPTS